MRRLLAVLVLVTIIGVGYRVNSANKPAEQNNVPNVDNQQSPPQTKQSKTQFDKNKHSLTDSASLWVVVNKQNQLNPKDYVPSNLAVPNVRLRLSSSQQQMKLSSQVIPNLEAMFAAAKKDSLELVFGSGYRSYNLQTQFYNSYVAKDGKAAADTYSARPGHSEHQTGLAVDITRTDGKCHLQKCFEDTAEGKWLAKNAYHYGFILRYQKDKVAVTGYEYEPWHFRYVGKELAHEMHRRGISTLEEFFNLNPAPSY